jgi:hypothetical protein
MKERLVRIAEALTNNTGYAGAPVVSKRRHLLSATFGGPKQLTHGATNARMQKASWILASRTAVGVSTGIVPAEVVASRWH